MTMRPMASIAAPVNPLSPTDKVYYADIPIDQIVFGAYQRQADMHRVRRMAASFDENRMRPVEVSKRDGKFFCWDGQHRVLMYSMLGRLSVPAMVHQDLDYRQEAQLFATQSENVGAVRSRSKWHALLEAQDNKALSVIRIARNHGYVVNPDVFNPYPGSAQCVASLLKAYEQLGENSFDRLFTILEQGFHGAVGSASKEIVDGLTAFLLAYDHDPAKPSQVDYKRLYAVLNKTTPQDLELTCAQYRVGSLAKKGKGVRMARVLVDLYNARLRQGKLDASRFAL